MHLKDAETFGQLIRHTRKENELTQAEVAAACGTGIRFIQELERGKASCQLGKALLVADMLNINIQAPNSKDSV